MGTDVRLTLRKPGVFGAELFTYPDDADTWTETDSGEVTISIETVSSRTFMRFVTSAVTEGVYKDFTVTAGQKVSCSFFVKSTGDTDEFTAIIYDVSNSTEITTYTPHTVDTTWRCYEIEFAAPTGCTTIRVTLNGVVADTYEVDSFAFNRDEIVIQPGYSLDENPDIVGVVKQSLDGQRIQHRLATHWRYELRWGYVEDAFYDRMVLLYESGETLYLDDGDVPDLTEQSTLYTNASYTFSGITNPSTTQVAYYSESADLPTNATQFEDAEYLDAWYTDLAAGTLRNHTFAYNKYLYHKFEIRPAEYGTGMQRLAITVKAENDDLDAANLDGVIVYVWNGSNWKEIIRTSSPSAEDETWYTYSASEAQAMCPQEGSGSNGIVRVLVRTRAYGDILADTEASVHLYPTGNQTLDTAAVPEVIEFDNEDFDTENEWDANAYKFIVTQPGKYLITLQAHFQNADAGNSLTVFLYKNGATYLAEKRMEALGVADIDFIALTAIVDLAAGDYIQAYASNVNKNNDVLTGTVDSLTYMMVKGLLATSPGAGLGMYTVSLETNPGLGAVEPSHQMWFETNSEANDIVVKNRTLGTQLTTSDYSVDYENNQLDITGQSGGDVLEFTYSRFREVRIAQLPARIQHDSPSGGVRRGMYVLLETTTSE